jgi:glycosyltransferase involved in cell wall biosynthesis
MISVVMPCYNAEPFVRSAIESILNQTFQSFELIIVDDGSTDGTIDIIQSYAAQDDRIRFLQTGNMGSGSGGAAKNLAIAQARYDWIALNDHDDISLPDRLEKLIRIAATQPQIVAWGGYVHHINATGKILSFQAWGPTSEAEFYALRQSGKPTFVLQPTAIFRKDIFLKAGGYQAAFKGADDLDLFDRMGNYGAMVAIPEPLALYRVHLNSMSAERFFHQDDLTRYILLRCQARVADRPCPDLETFLAAQSKRSPLSRLRDAIETRGRYYYRQSGLSYAEGYYLRAIQLFGLSVLLRPGYSLPRVWRQLLSAKARRWAQQTQVYQD